MHWKNPVTHLFLFLAVTTLHAACSKEKPAPIPQATPKPQVEKISLPLTQLSGLTINGEAIASLTTGSSDPQALEAEDLGKAFGIKNEKYLNHAMKQIQRELQSGAPLKSISVFLGKVPKKYAAQCLEEAENGFCLIEPYAFNCSDAIPQKNWNTENYAKLCLRLGRLKAFKPDFLVALFDGDNTLWYQDVSDASVKKGVDSKRILWDDAKAELLSIYPIPAERAGYKKQKNPYEYYLELYEKAGPLWNYNYGALAFRGLPLKEVFANYQEMVKEPYAPIPFPEMSDLIRYLNQQGIIVGVVSASPIFEVIPSVERLGAGIPLERIRGLDVYVKNPAETNSKPIRLSRLINQGDGGDDGGSVTPFRSYQEVLAKYGDWIIVDVDQVINARDGKGVSSRSIARTHVAERNRKVQNPNDRISIDEMRLVLIAGDNFSRSTDILKTNGNRQTAALETGNDQGLSEGLTFLKKKGSIPGGADFIFIQRQILDTDNKVIPKPGKLENFQAYIEQQKLIRPDSLGEIITQTAITDVKAVGGKGGFLKSTPQTASESQPSSETQSSPPASPTAQGAIITPKPVASPKPAAPVQSPAPAQPAAAQPAPPAAAPKLPEPIAPTAPKLDKLP